MSPVTHGERLRSEIAHSKKIASTAQAVWNWEGVIGRARYDRRVRHLSTALRPDVLALELGCGTGLFSEAFSRTGAMLISIDISPDLIRLARAKALPNVKFTISDACRTSFKDKTFDVIVGSSILHHLDIPAGIRECYRLLRPGGSLWLTEPNYINPHIFLERKVTWIKKRLGVSRHESAIVRWRLATLLKKTGFNRVEIRPFDFLYPFLPPKYLPLLKKFQGLAEKTFLLREIAGSVKITAIK